MAHESADFIALGGTSVHLKERSRSPVRPRTPTRTAEDPPADRGPNRRGGLNNKPAWMTRGIGVNKEIFGETKGDLMKPGMTKADLERIEKQIATGPDPFGDVFNEAKAEKEKASSAVSSTPAPARINTGPLPSQDETFGGRSGWPATPKVVLPRPLPMRPAVPLPSMRPAGPSTGACGAIVYPSAAPGFQRPTGMSPVVVRPQQAHFGAMAHGSVSLNAGWNAHVAMAVPSMAPSMHGAWNDGYGPVPSMAPSMNVGWDDGYGGWDGGW